MTLTTPSRLFAVSKWTSIRVIAMYPVPQYSMGGHWTNKPAIHIGIDEVYRIKHINGLLRAVKVNWL